jgi:murein DD-endopeptidase MepM/ murein hydrolase activator NlpD
MHSGLDIATSRGTPVYATANGKITEASYSGGFGNVITIDHGYSYKTRYAHLSGFAIAKGDQVQKGDIIGYVGSTGRSTSSHLHYEVHKKGVAVNPKDFLTE